MTHVSFILGESTLENMDSLLYCMGYFAFSELREKMVSLNFYEFVELLMKLSITTWTVG